MRSKAVRHKVKALKLIPHKHFLLITNGALVKTLWMMFSEQSSCTRHAVAALEPFFPGWNCDAAVIAGDKRPIKTVWKCLFTCRATWKLSEQNGRLELVIDWTGFLQNHAPLSFNTNTYGLFIVRYIVLAWLRMWAVIIHAFSSPLLCAPVYDRVQIEVQIGHLRPPQKNVSVCEKRQCRKQPAESL